MPSESPVLNQSLLCLIFIFENITDALFFLQVPPLNQTTSVCFLNKLQQICTGYYVFMQCTNHGLHHYILLKLLQICYYSLSGLRYLAVRKHYLDYLDLLRKMPSLSFLNLKASLFPALSYRIYHFPLERAPVKRFTTQIEEYIY